MSNKRNKKIQKRQFHFYKSPILIVVIFTILMAAFFIISFQASAQMKSAVTNGLTYASSMGLGTRDLRTIIFTIVNVLLGFLALVAVLIIMYGGFVWMTSKGDPNRIEDAKRILTNAVIGLVIIFLSFSIAHFIFRMLLGAILPYGPGGPGMPPGPCTNCSALGDGIIESVYPLPGATDVPRNTMIFVTFKEPMQDDTICQNGACNTSFNNGAENVKISYRDPRNTSNIIALVQTDIDARKSGTRTYVFYPQKLLGDGLNNVTYTVRLGRDIKKADGAGAFGMSYFDWSFTIGTREDLIPPQVKNIFPPPDGNFDTYTPTAPAQSQGSITVAGAPNTLINPSVTITRTAPPLPGGPGDPVETLIGNYNGTYAGKLTITAVDTTLAANADIRTICGNGIHFRSVWNPLRAGLPAGYCVNAFGTGIVLDDGLAVSFNIAVVAGNQWEIDLVGFRTPDTLRVSNITYTFISNAIVTPGARDIKVPDLFNLDTQAQRIRDKVNGTGSSPAVTATVAGSVVTITASVAGTAGDSIPIVASGSWRQAGDSQTLSGGQDQGFRITPIGNKDIPRNAVLKINFNEVMMPNTIGGVVEITAGATQYVGTRNGGTYEIIGVQADMNGINGFEDSEFVEGEFYVSNLYKTAEFLAKGICGTCQGGDNSGGSCTTVAECPGGGTCAPIRNSCGEFVHCLPTRVAGAGNWGGVTNYRVLARAATLAACAGPADCQNPKYKECVGGPPGVCNTGAPDNINYPQGNFNNMNGALDAAINSLDGDFDENAEGPTPDPGVGHNYTIDNQGDNGDNVYWEFWVNNLIRLTPPHIQDIGDANVTPVTINDTGVNLIDNPEARFDTVLLESTLKPGSGYKDGLCYCTANNECPKNIAGQPDKQECINNRCQSKVPGDDFSCQKDKDCNPAGTQKCYNKRYVSLIDKGCVKYRGLYYTGWWITSNGYEDPAIPVDGIFDFTAPVINHTPFCEMTRYGAEMGSGIKDVYQNCYLPSGSIGVGACPADQTNPYCCNGVPSPVTRPYCCPGGASANPC